jgi:hypothetical protein
VLRLRLTNKIEGVNKTIDVRFKFEYQQKIKSNLLTLLSKFPPFRDLLLYIVRYSQIVGRISGDEEITFLVENTVLNLFSLFSPLQIQIIICVKNMFLTFLTTN